MQTRVAIEFPQVGDGTFIESNGLIYPEELQLAFRNKAIPLEALRYDVTPTGMHYSLTHYDVPAIDPASWRLTVSRASGHAKEFDLPSLKGRA